MGIRYFSSSSRKVSPKGWPNEEEFDDEDPFNQRSNEQKEEKEEQRPVKLTHVNQNGTAHMVAVGNKRPTHRTAFAVSTVRFSKPEPLRLIKQNAIKKGDVLSVARIAGIMAAKQTPTIIPLCHNIDITHAEVEAGLIEPPQPAAESSSSSTTISRGANEEVAEEDYDDDEPSALTHRRPESRARLYSTSHLSPGDPRAVADAAAYPFGGVMLTARVETTGRTGVEMDALHAASAAALTVYDMCKAVDKAMSLQNGRVVLKTGGKSGDWVDVGWLFARAGVVRRKELDGLMTTAGGPVDEGVRRAIAEMVAKEAADGEGGGEGGMGLARREWKKCYRVLTRSGWEPEKAMQLLSWIPRKAYSPAAVENGGAEGVEGEEEGVAAAEAEALEEEVVVEEDDAEALEEEEEGLVEVEEEELVEVEEEEENVEDWEELAADDYATILEQQLREELEELEREELLDEEGETDDVEEVQNGSVDRQEEQQQSAKVEEEKEDAEPAPPSTTTATSSKTSPSSALTIAASASAGANLKKPVETTMTLFHDAHMADADSNQNPLLTASMIRQMSPRDLFADNASSSGKRREFQTKAQKIQEEKEVEEESDREFEEEVSQKQKEYLDRKERAYREQRKQMRRLRKKAIKQEERDLKREKEQEKKKRLDQLLALEAEEMRRNRLEAQEEAKGIVKNTPANVLRNSEGDAKRDFLYTTPPRRPTPSFHHDPEGFIAAAERRSKGDKGDGIGFALPQVQPTAQDIKRAQKSRASTEPMPEHLKDPAERLQRQRWLRDRLWDKRMEKLAALERMVAVARRSPKYSPHWLRARSQGGKAMVTVALAAKIGVHTTRYDILQWKPPGLEDEEVEKVGEEVLRESWEKFVKTRPPKMTWKYMQLRKQGIDTKYVLRHRVLDEKERLKRAMSRVDYNEWCLLNNVMAKRERRWEREAGFAQVEERAQEETRKVLSTPAPGENWYDQLLEEMEDDVKDDTKDKGRTESVSDESSNAEDGSDDFDELQSLIDKKGRMTTERKEGTKGKKGKKGEGKGKRG